MFIESLKLLRPLSAFAMLFVFIFGGILASVSASNSLPGDTLYTLKLTQEKIQVTLVTDKSAKADLQMKRAKTRVEEIKKVAISKPDKAKELITKTANEYKKVMAEAKENVELVKKSDPKRAIVLAQTLKTTASEVKESAKDIVGEDIQEVVKDLATDAKKTELQAAVTIVTSSEEGEAKEKAKADLKEVIKKASEETVVENTKTTTESTEATKENGATTSSSTAPTTETTTTTTPSSTTTTTTTTSSSSTPATTTTPSTTTTTTTTSTETKTSVIVADKVITTEVATKATELINKGEVDAAAKILSGEETEEPVPNEQGSMNNEQQEVSTETVEIKK